MTVYERKMSGFSFFKTNIRLQKLHFHMKIKKIYFFLPKEQLPITLLFSWLSGALPGL